MPFCTKCGNKLEEDDVFCGVCGTAVPLVGIVGEDDAGDEEPELAAEPEPAAEPKPAAKPEPKVAEPEKPSRESQVKRCPACGEVVGEHDFTCVTCGFELRHPTDGSINELYLKLEQIESLRPEKSKKDPVGDSATDEKLATVIRNFPIPNTKEDLVEFLVMANANSLWDDDSGENEAVPSAWRSKFEQAYDKAEILFGDDASFNRFRKLKKHSEEKVKEGKATETKTILISLAFIVACIGFICCIPLISNLVSGIEAENTRLQGVLSQVYEYADQGKYAQARQEAAELVYSKSTNNSDAKQAAERWDDIRKEALEMISKKERGE